ncbi:MAG: A24 family peptidase [Candidatus Krumholzibacteriia bacterium]
MTGVATVLLAGCLGACAGSFATVLVHRLPRGLGWVRGRSRCPRCGAVVAWRDNVPLLGWLARRGRCRDCGGAIPRSYPALELAGAVLAMVAVARLGPGPGALRVFLFLWLLLVAAVIDARWRIIPPGLTLSGLASGLALAPWGGPGLAAAAVGALVGGGVLAALAAAYRRLRGRHGLGGGDVALLAMIGAHLGPWGALASLGLGALLGTAAVLPLLGRRDRFYPVPFGPFLAAAAAVVLAWGPRLWRWYLDTWFAVTG